MFQPHLPPRWKTRTAALLGFAAAAVSTSNARAQSITMMVTDPNPLGLGAFVPTGAELGFEGGFKGDLSYGIGIESSYNTNFFQEEDGESELSTFFTPWLRYVSDPEGGARFSLIANYQPTYRTYLENSELNGLDQSADITFSFRASRTEADVFARYTQISGTDLLTGEYVEGTIFTTGIRANRQIASRTSLNAGLSYAKSEYGSTESTGATVTTAYFGGRWEATPRLAFGPTIRYTNSESGNTGTRDAWALLLETRYRWGERIWLSASFGPEYAQNSGGGSDKSSVGLTGDLTAKYVINERWAWTTSIRSATVPSANETNYLVNNVAISSLLQRQLVRGAVGFGVQYNYSEYNDVGDVAMTVGDQNTAAAFLTYDRPLFHERVDFNAGLRYTMNEGDTDWSQWIFSAGLRAAF